MPSDRCTRVAHLALLAIVPATALAVGPHLMDPWVLPKQAAWRVLIAVAWTAWWLSRRPAELPRSGVVRAVLALLVITSLATGRSVAPLVSLRGGYQTPGGLLTVVDGLLLMLLAALALRGREVREQLAGAIVATATVSAVIGLAQHVGWLDGWWELGSDSGAAALRYRAFGLLASPSFLGLYLAMALPLAVRLAVSSAGQRQRPAGWLALLLIVAALALTYSRAAWLAAAGAAVLVVTTAVPRPRRLAAVAALLLGVGLGAGIAAGTEAPSLFQRARTLSLADGGSAAVRLHLWRAARAMSRARPMFGWGPETFRHVLPRFAPERLNAAQRRNPSAHNELLDALAQTGWLGLLATVYLWLTVVAAVGRARRTWSDDGGLAWAIAAALLAGLIGVQFGFASTPLRALWWLLVGALVSAAPARPAEPGDRRAATSAVFAATALLLVLHTGRAVLADAACWHGERLAATDQRERALAALALATRLDPQQDFYQAVLGQALEASGQDPAACYLAACRTNPANPGNLALLAGRLQTDGAWPSALAAWQQVVELDPRWAEAHNALGVACHRLGRDLEAVAAYQRALAIEPSSAEAFNNLGNAYLALGQRDQAVAAFRGALVLRPGWLVAQDNLAQALESGPPAGR